MSKWELRISEHFNTSFKKLDLIIQKRVNIFLQTKLLNSSDPSKLGKPLQGQLKGLIRYRVGDYRILAQLKHDTFTIIAIELGHRREIYRH